MRTIKKEKVYNNVYRLADLGCSRGFAVQVLDGKRYYTVEWLGWLTERDARAFFNEYVGIKG